MAIVRIDLEMLPTIISHFSCRGQWILIIVGAGVCQLGDSKRQFREIYIVQLVINLRRMLG
jgi:hypothetical protein